jgi:hypothetical protein
MQRFRSSNEYFYHIFSHILFDVLSQLLLRAIVYPYFYPSPSALRHVPVYLELLYRCPQYFLA